MPSFLFALLCLVVLRPANLVLAGSLAPPDTLAGEEHLTRRFAQGICEQIAMESRHQDLTVLTHAQGIALLQDMLGAVIMRDSMEFKAFIVQAPDATAAVQRLSMQAVLRLSSICSSASRLLTQMGIQMTSMDTTLSGSQQKLLQTVAHDFCEQLVAAEAKSDFSRRTASERLATFREIRHGIIIKNGQALLDAFGSELLTNEQLEDKMWQNVNRLMFEECPTTTALLRVDRGLEQIQQQALPAQSGSATKVPTVPHSARRPKK